MGSFSGWKNIQFQIESINIAPNFFRFTFRFIDRQLRIVAEVGAGLVKAPRRNFKNLSTYHCSIVSLSAST